jgi:membrane-bound lytic murein transglycosylase C
VLHQLRPLLFIPLILCLQAYADGFPTDDSFDRVQTEANSYEKGVKKEQSSYEDQVKKEWESYQAKVKQEWNDGLIPEQKRFVEYNEDFSGRIRVDYETGEVTADSLQSPDDPQAKEKAALAIQQSLKKASESDKASNLPVFESAASDREQVKVEEPKSEKGTDGIERKLYSYHFKMPSDYLNQRMKIVLPWVKEWADKNQIDPSLILAVIRQESAFNPKARSWVPAFGLMQIVPTSAGREVLKKLSGKTGTPDEDTLYDSRSNIMFGSTYLKLLDQHFQNIKSDLNRSYLVICAYNWGPGRISKAIDTGRIHPQASAEQLFSELQGIVPKETQGYL